MMSLNKQSPVELANQEPVSSTAYERHAIVPEGQMCMNKGLLLAVLGTLLAVILIQAIFVGKFIFQRVLAMREPAAEVKQYY